MCYVKFTRLNRSISHNSHNNIRVEINIFSFRDPHAANLSNVINC